MYGWNKEDAQVLKRVQHVALRGGLLCDKNVAEHLCTYEILLWESENFDLFFIKIYMSDMHSLLRKYYNKNHEKIDFLNAMVQRKVVFCKDFKLATVGETEILHKYII